MSIPELLDSWFVWHFDAIDGRKGTALMVGFDLCDEMPRSTWFEEIGSDPELFGPFPDEAAARRFAAAL